MIGFALFVFALFAAGLALGILGSALKSEDSLEERFYRWLGWDD